MGWKPKFSNTAFALLSSGIIHSGKLHNPLSQQHPKFADTLHNSDTAAFSSTPRQLQGAGKSSSLKPNPAPGVWSSPRAPLWPSRGRTVAAAAQPSQGCGPKVRRRQGQLKPAQIPPAAGPWGHSGLCSQTLPRGSSTWLPAGWGLEQGTAVHLCACHLWLRNSWFTTQPSAISCHCAFPGNGVRPLLHSILPQFQFQLLRVKDYL